MTYAIPRHSIVAIALVALIPKRGGTRTTAELAKALKATPGEVRAILTDVVAAGELIYDDATDTYSTPAGEETSHAE